MLHQSADEGNERTPEGWLRGVLSVSWPVGLVLFCSTLLVAGITPTTGLAIAALVCGLAVHTALRHQIPYDLLSALLLGLCVLTLLQIVPLPLGLLAQLSPDAARVWTETTTLLGEPVTWAPLSLEPAATRVKALELLAAGVFALLCSRVARRVGARPLVAVISVVACWLVLATLVHRALDAEKVFGWYRPLHSGFVAPLMNTNNLAGILNLAFFCCGGLALDARVRSGSRRAAGLGCVLLSGVLVWTGSRGGVVLFGIGLLAFVGLFIWRRSVRPTSGSRWELLVLVLAAVVGTGLAAFSIVRLERELLETQLEKFDVIVPSLKALKEYWPVGAGRGSFSVAVSPHVSAFVRPGSFEHAEIFPLQWAVEWGVAVAVSLTVLVVYWLWPRAELTRMSGARVGAYIGLCALWLHNLVDFSLEVPLVALAAVAAACAFGKFEAAPSLSVVRVPTRRRGRAFVLSCAALGLALALWQVAQPVELGRSARHRIAHSSKMGELRLAELREVLSEHPGDAYLLRLAAAAAAVQQRPDALRVAGWAVERAPSSGRTLLLLADLLHHNGATTQALGILRRANDADARLVDEATKRAFAWAPDEVERIVPSGPNHVRTLEAMAHSAREPRQRLAFRSRAAKAAPKEARLQIVLLSDALAARDEDCVVVLGEACKAWVVGRRADLSGADSPQLTELDASLLLADGKPEAAFQLLQHRCPRSRAGLGCLRRMFAISLGLPNEQRLDAAGVFLSAACHDDAACAEAESLVGREFATHGLPDLALHHLSRAARLDPDTARWQAVAGQAIRIKDLGALETALRSMGNLGAAPPSELVNALERLRREALEAQ